MKRVGGWACWTMAAAIALGGCVSSANKDSEEKPKGSITMKTAKRLKKVGEYAKKQEWEAALAELDEIAAGKYLNPYEKAMIWQARAGVHAAMLKPEEVVTDLEQALALDALSKQERIDATYNLGQAYLMSERFSESADTFARWAKEAEKQEPAQQFVIASAFANAKRFEEALPYAEKAVEGNEKPPEPWLKLLVSLHYELNHNAELVAVLERLNAAYPKKEYQLQLSEAYAAAGDEKKKLSTLEAALAKGQLTKENEIVALVTLRLRHGSPGKGAALLSERMQQGKVEKTAQNLELLAACWIAAEDAEHAEAVLESAGDEAHGELYFNLGLLYAGRSEWSKARDALALAITRGGLSAPGEAQLLLGVAHYNTKRTDAALASLTAAKRHADVAGCADKWIKVVKSGKAGAKADCLVIKNGSGAAAGRATASK